MKKPEAPPPLLYKYYGPARFDVFEHFRVRFSQLAALNDPFEFLVHAPPGVLRAAADQTAREVASPINYATMVIHSLWKASPSPDVYKRWPLIVRGLFRALMLPLGVVLAIALYPFMHRSLRHLSEASADELETVLLREAGDGLILVFSCSEAWDSVPMWAHYAGNHSGFVIGIDPGKAFPSQDSKGNAVFAKPRRVMYQDDTPSIRLGTFDNVMDFIATKMAAWSYEREWRFTEIPDHAAVRGIVAEGLEILLFDLNPDAVQEVIFGTKCKPAKIKRVVKALKRAGIAPSMFVTRRSGGYGFERVHIDSVLNTGSVDPTARPVPSFKGLEFPRMLAAYRALDSAASEHPLLRWLNRRGTSV